MIRSFPRLIAVFVFSSVMMAGEPDAESQGNPELIKAAVERAIPYLKKDGEAWMKKRGCVSCHQIPSMLWSLSVAQQNGYDVDPNELRQWQDWSTFPKNFVKPEQKSDVDVEDTLSKNIDTMNALLLAMEGVETTGEPNWRSTFADALVTNQKPNGSWQACGQLPLQKRPKQESNQVTVLWTLLALSKQNIEAHDFDAALTVAENPNPKSTEWWVARLLLADQLDDGRTTATRAKLLELQRDDGGWGWLVDEPSDALATGMSLYALRKTSHGSTDYQSATQAAAEFLTSTQSNDGSWPVPGTKQAARKKPTPTAKYWGTAWAVVGLLE